MSLPVVLQLLATIALLITLTVAMQMDDSPSSTRFTMMNTAVLLIMLGYLFELQFPQTANVFAVRALQLLGVVFLYPLYLSCVCSYFGVRLPKYGHLALIVVPAAIVIPLLLNYAEYLVYMDGGNSPAIGSAEYTLYLLCYGYPALCLLVGTAILLRRAVTPQGFNRAHAILFIFNVLLAHAGVGLFYAGVFGGYNPFSMLLAVSCIITSVATTRNRVRGWASSARVMALKNSPEGYMLVDSASRYVESNDFTKQLFPELGSVHHTTAVSFFPEVQRLVTAAENLPAGETVLFRHAGRQLRIGCLPLEYGGNKVAHVIQISDETQLQVMRGEVTRLELHEPETGYYNIHAFMDSAERDFTICSRDGHAASVLALRADELAALKDQSHALVQALARQLGAHIEAAVRDTDLITHSEGVFLVFLFDADLGHALKLAEAIRKRAAGEPLALGNASLQYTISAGVAAFVPERHHDLQALLHEAKAALYTAGEMGGDRSCLAGLAAKRHLAGG